MVRCTHHWDIGSDHRDQVYPYVMSRDGLVVYKLLGPQWKMFRRTSLRSRRYKRSHMVAYHLPRWWQPVRVIEAAQEIIVLRAGSAQVPVGMGPRPDDITNSLYEQVIGKYEIDEAQWNKLYQQWHMEGNTIVVATDGGLKGSIGTSSYAFFFNNDEKAIISGQAGEYQPRDTASSTRQELLGQLGVEYWLGKLADKWGVPRNGCQIVLITDSKASIEIMRAAEEGLGITTMLRPEMDVCLEMLQQRQKKQWARRCVVKVQSHITQEEAPNEFFWSCNEHADQLATTARDRFDADMLRGRAQYIFPGTKIGCKVEGRMENNNLATIIKEHIAGLDLQAFLIERYGWTGAIFKDIAWKPHLRELSKYSLVHRVTLIKYLHGWLATTQRRWQEGSLQTPHCPLCGKEETREDIFRCSNVQYAKSRTPCIDKLIKEISDNTTTGCRHVFLAGLKTVFGSEHPPEATMKDWPINLQDAYKAQVAIGWNQVLYGRISTQWNALASGEQFTGSLEDHKWTGKVIRSSWRLGLDLWKLP